MPRNEPHRQISDLPTLPSLAWLCLQRCTDHQKSFIEWWFWGPQVWFAGSLLLHCLPSWQTVIAIGTIILLLLWVERGGGPDPPLLLNSAFKSVASIWRCRNRSLAGSCFQKGIPSPGAQFWPPANCAKDWGEQVSPVQQHLAVHAQRWPEGSAG